MTQRKLSLLFIEDDEQIRELTTMVLQREGHSVLATSCAQSALEDLNKVHYDLVLSDFFLEDTNGLELIEKIREFNQTIPIIVATGNRELVQESITDNNVYIIHKPFRSRDLLVLINEVCP
ncbi:response regulator receiver domain protein [Bacteriovorax sp. BSW11_IV]|uniref:response regulator n=1 Tax=Bacteriovorax sp. BSW11_IV TaxID=1353529 RepID=UPI00038A07A3|nr:response regulator [Bacteriovorax sp. BSW11_IV]EQC48183.1 response regulator receiver domain protein [Bacteriovorax sp. BSW11_IV]